MASVRTWSSRVIDYIVWYAKNSDMMKYRPACMPRSQADELERRQYT